MFWRNKTRTWIRTEGSDIPAIGGKRMARRPRKISEEHMVAFKCLVSFLVVVRERSFVLLNLLDSDHNSLRTNGEFSELEAGWENRK